MMRRRAIPFTVRGLVGLVLALFAVAGCNDYCDDSAVKQFDCGQFPPEGDECTPSDHDQCINGCIANASCDDLKSGKYKVCTGACSK